MIGPVELLRLVSRTMKISEDDIRELFESVIEEYGCGYTVTPPVFHAPEPAVEFRKNCKRCGGSGWVFGDIEDYLRCPECDGFGVERKF